MTIWRSGCACRAKRLRYDGMFQQLLLLEDMLVYIQNEALADIVARRVPVFRPRLHTDTPRFVLRGEDLFIAKADGTLMFPRTEANGEAE